MGALTGILERILAALTLPYIPVDPALCNGRLTLETGHPVPTSDHAGMNNLYFSPYLGSQIALYDGVSSWNPHSFAELNIDNTGLGASTVYDVFVKLVAGTPTLVLVAWTNPTTRAESLAILNGIYVRASDNTARYVGSVMTSTPSQFDDFYSRRMVFNAQNRITRFALCNGGVASWTIGASTWELAGGAAFAIIEVLDGLGVSFVNLTSSVRVNDSAGASQAAAGIGVNQSTVDNSANSNSCGVTPLGTDVTVSATLALVGSIGYSFYAWLEYCTAIGTATGYKGSLSGTFET